MRQRAVRALRPELLRAVLEERRLLAVTDVSSGQVFNTIQAAVNAANAGDTILVDPGIYTETVNVNKSLALEGAQHGVDGRTRGGSSNESLLNATGGGWNVTASGVTIDGFVVGGRTDINPSAVAIILANTASGARILNDIVGFYTVALSLATTGAEQDVIKQNNFSNGTTLLPGMNTGTGIQSDAGAQNVLIDSNIFGGFSFAAIRFDAASAAQSNITISNNQITSAGLFHGGIVLANVSDAQITGNTILNANSSGVDLAGGDSGVAVVGNSFTTDFYAGVNVSNGLASGANSDVAVRFNRFVNNASAGVAVATGAYSGGVLDATDNWWGSNEGPNASRSDKTIGDVNATPYLVLSVSAVPGTIGRDGTTVITADLTKDSSGMTPVLPEHLLDGTPIGFEASIGNFSAPGEFTPAFNNSTTNGREETRFTAYLVGVISINASLDNQIVSALIQVTPINFSSDRLPADTVGQHYTGLVSATGGAGGFTFTVPSGKLPAGLNLDRNTGAIAGTPTAPGSSTFTIQATDASGATASQDYTLAINPPIAFTTTSEAETTVGAAFSRQLTTIGGTGPLTFALTTGSLPAGLTLSSGGVISGTPTTAESSDFTVTVIDATGASASRAFSVLVHSAPSPPSPTVTNLQRFGIHNQPTILVLTFNTTLDPATAQTVYNYSLAQLIKGKPRHSIALRSAVYNATNNTVTLSPVSRLRPGATYRLTVNGMPPSGLSDPTGQFLAGENGRPGTNFVRDFGRAILAGPNLSRRDIRTALAEAFAGI